jgi:hypothetical protein
MRAGRKKPSSESGERRLRSDVSRSLPNRKGVVRLKENRSASTTAQSLDINTTRRVRRYKRNARDGGSTRNSLWQRNGWRRAKSYPICPARWCHQPSISAASRLACRGKGPKIQAQTATDELTAGVRDERWGRNRMEWAASSRTLPVCDAPDTVRRGRKVGRRCATLTRKAWQTRRGIRIKFSFGEEAPKQPRFSVQFRRTTKSRLDLSSRCCGMDDRTVQGT